MDLQDRAAVHQNCIAVGRILQNISLRTAAAEREPCLRQITKSYYLCMNALFKDLRPADFKPKIAEEESRSSGQPSQTEPPGEQTPNTTPKPGTSSQVPLTKESLFAPPRDGP